jgi:hypothetical protein
LLGGPTHHEGLAIDRTFDSSKKSCPNPVHKYVGTICIFILGVFQLAVHFNRRNCCKTSTIKQKKGR